ncbi:MAG: MFS transporter [Myxococcales bacterium]|nr:MFS transporter [Myxococcales bacterium]
MRDVWSLMQRRPHFRRLWWSTVIAELGNWLSYIALSALVLARDGGAWQLALIFAAHLLPDAVLAPITGPLADRLDRGALMRWSHIIRGGLTLAMGLTAIAGAFGLLQVLLAARMIVGAFLPPAERAALPSLVEDDELDLANRLSALTWSVLFTIGVALGGVLSALFGPVIALFIDAGTFAAAALILRGLPPLRADADDLGPLRVRRLFGELWSAWRATRPDPELRRVAVSKLPFALLLGGSWITLNLAAFDLGGAVAGAALLGVLQAIRGIGTGVGPVLAARLGQRLGHPIERSGDLIAFVAVAALIIFNSPVGLAIATFFWGMGAGHNWVWTTTGLQRLAPDARLGRLSAIDTLVVGLGATLTCLIGGALSEHLGSVHAGALLGLSLGFAAWLLLGQRSRVRAGDPAYPDAAGSRA